MSKLRAALLFSALAQQSNLLISFFSVAVIARLLTPTEVGVFAVASSLAALGIEVRSFGVGQYLVREKMLTDEKRSTAFGVNLAISWLLAAIVILGANAVAGFYQEPDLRYVFWILSGTFILSPFATVPFATFQRDMRFDIILRIKLASGIARAGGSIGFVLLGWSYLGLAAGVLLGAVVELAAISFHDRQKSLLRPGFSQWRAVLGFGMVSSGAGVLQRVTHGVPDLILGRLATMADVGMFSRGFGLVLFLNKLISMAVGPVILPHLSSIRRRSGDVGAEYLRCIALHGAVSLPAFAVAGVLALPLIRLFFGDQWDAAAPIASVLALWAMLQTVHGFIPNALVATGHERTLLGREAIVLLVRIAFILIAADQGLMAVAWAIVLSGLFDLALCTWLAKRYLGLSPRRVLSAFAPNALLAIGCTVAARTTLTYLPETLSHPVIQVLASAAATSVIWLCLLRLTNHELWRLGSEAVIDGLAALRRKPDAEGT